MDRLHIRLYEPADRLLLRRALIALQDFEVPLHDTRLPGETTVERYLERMLRELAEGEGTIFIAELEGEFVGFVGCLVAEDDVIQETADSNRYGYVKDIFVAPPHRGRGAAQQLLAAAERYLAKTGVTRLRLNVLANNLTARRAYDRYGFAPYEILYEKRIGRTDPL